MKRINRIALIAIVVALIAAGIGFIKNKSTPNSKTGDIKIGAALILSGEGASWGESAKNGVSMAVNEINTDGGIDGRMISVVYEDANSPQTAISAFQKLTTVDGVRFIIGPNWSVQGIPLIKLADQTKVVVISPSLGVKEFNESSKYLFNTWPHDFILSRNLADYAYNKGRRNVALLGANEVWVKDQTSNFADRFKQIGGKVALTYEPLTTESDVRSELLKIKADKTIDAIVLTTDGYSLTDVIAKQLKALSISLPVYAITIDGQILKDCNGACDGFTMLTFLTPTKEFSDKYVKTYNRNVEVGSDSAYDAVMILAGAIRETKSTDTDKVAQYLSSVKNYSGASGELVSDSKNAFTKPFLVTKIVNGVPVPIKE